MEAFLKRVIWRLIIGDAAYDSIKAIGVALILAIRRGKPRGRRAKIGKFLEAEEGQKAFGLRGQIASYRVNL